MSEGLKKNLLFMEQVLRQGGYTGTGLYKLGRIWAQYSFFNHTLGITFALEGSSSGHQFLSTQICQWLNYLISAAAAKLLQSCPTLCDPIDGSPPASPIPGILQARTLEWVAISFSNAWKWRVKVKLLSHVRLLVTPWTVAHQAPPPMGLFRQEYWSGVQSPSPI